MRQRRTEKFSDKYGKAIEEIIRRNTYGEPRERRRCNPQQMPIITDEIGIKLKWDHRFGEYPTEIILKMTDGRWVKYQIDIPQPGYVKAADVIKDPAYKHGVQREKR